MPLLTLDISGAPLNSAQRTQIQQGLTRLMSDLLGKVADLTVVHVRESAPTHWSVGGQPLSDSQWCASLTVAITEGSNSVQQQASFLANAHELLAERIGRPPSAPLYIVMQNLPGAHWGYGGRTQASRRPVPPSSERPLTLKQLSGGVDLTTLPVPGTALVLVDFQGEYEHDGRVPLEGLGAAAHEADRLVQGADACGVPVIHVHHVASQTGAALFDRNGPGITPCLKPTVRAQHRTLIKHWPSAFHDTALRQALRQQDIHTIVLAGCMTHNCVDSTARHALHLGLQVIVAADACATRALPAADGSIIPADVVQRTALAALADRHATVVSARELVSRWQRSLTSAPPSESPRAHPEPH